MDNPRFPHTLQVLRARRADGRIQLTAEGDPIYDVLPLDKVETIDGSPIRKDGQFVTTPVETLNFGYRTDTMNTKETGDAISLNLKLSCPMFLTELLYDDVVVLTDYERTFRTRVVKKATHNWGTNIWVDEIRN